MKINSLQRGGLVLGFGLGGLFDGIVFHQILGWHHLVCTTETCRPDSIAALNRQITQDGFFDFTVLSISVVGIGLLFSALRSCPDDRPSQITWGAVFAGWGMFNLIEGLLDHQILGLHHVLPGDPHQFLFDMLFLAFGLLLVVGGGAWMHRARRN
jgi:uncharacterized membrane protein